MSKPMQLNSLSSLTPDFQAFWNSGAPSLDSAVKNYTAWLSDFSRLQNETLCFMNVRLSEDYQAAAQLAACKSPTEAFEFQLEYAGKVASEFMAESKKMLELCGHLATSALPKRS